MSIFRKRSPFSNIPLRWVLVIPFVVQIVGAVGLVGYLSYRSGQSAVENMVHQVSDQATSRVRDHLTNSLQNQHQAVAISQRDIQNGTLNINNLESLRQHFWRQISLSPSLGAIYFANEKGEMTGYGRILSQEAIEQTKQLTGQDLVLGESILLETTAQDLTHRKYYVIDNQGKARKLYGNLPIDNRTTVWYRAGKAAPQQTWSPIYVFQDSPTLGINTVAPIRDADGKFQGVLSTSIRLTAIGTFLKQLNFSPSGQAFIIERTGDLVATSTLEIPYQQDPTGKTSRLPANQSKDARTRLVTTQIQQKYGDLQQIKTKQILEMTTEGTVLFVQIEPYQDNFGIDWLLVAVIPESDFMGAIRTNAEWTTLLCIFTLIAITGIGILTARWITRPILRLSQASEAIAIGNWQKPLPEDQAIAELQTLSVAFNVMASQVRQSFDRIEYALRESEEKYKILFEKSPVCISITDGRGIIIESNSIAQQFFGITHTVLTECKDREISPNVIRPDGSPMPVEEYACMRALKSNESVYDVETGIVCIDGNLRWFSVSAAPIALEQYGVILVHVDISDRKKIEIALAEAKENAEAATKAKSEFLANMSHELRTPMNGVIGMSQILATTNLSKQQQDYLKTIRDSGDALLSVINDILDFSKIESGMLAIEEKDFSLVDVVKTACNLLNNQAIDKHIYLHYEIAPDIPNILIGDRTHLRQILLNLVGNAIKFTQYGQVSVSVNGRYLHQLSQQESGKLESLNYELEIQVSDTGIGIHGDQIGRLFQPFTQADTSISRRYGGTGLGLTISKRLVELMGGKIWVESFGRVGGNPPPDWEATSKTQGSTFYVVVTVSTSSMIPKPQESSDLELIIDNQLAEKFPLRILLVEDNKVNQMVGCLLLEQLGYQVNTANNGLEAVQAVQAQDYDLILMDLQMPEMDGLTATKIIREELNYQARIVAMTADVSPKDRQDCLDAGMDDHISKPINIQQLTQLVSSSL
jgi:PAS domain S-box-containing protein